MYRRFVGGALTERQIPSGRGGASRAGTTRARL